MSAKAKGRMRGPRSVVLYIPHDCEEAWCVSLMPADGILRTLYIRADLARPRAAAGKKGKKR